MSHDHLGQADHPRIRWAILKTLIYGDLFDYPLSSEEIVRYLPLPASPDVVQDALGGGTDDGTFAQSNGFFTLPGRTELVPIRERRENIARRKWAVARRYGRWLARLPFVRMVAVTGTLAVNNVEEEDDVDFFIVTAADRLWLCRALVILVVRFAALAGHELCPNYFRSEQKLVFKNRNFFDARELAQMVPLYGRDVYERMRKLNDWTTDYFPHAAGTPDGMSIMTLGPRERALKRVAERALAGRLGALFETWESGRKIKRFRERAEAEDARITFTSDCCQGHFDRHDEIINRLFRERLAQYGVSEEGDHERHKVREARKKEATDG